MTIRRLSDDLYSATLTQQDGQQLHFGFERMDNETCPFWGYYGEQAPKVSSLCNLFCKELVSGKAGNYPNRHSQNFDYTEDQYRRVVELVKRKNYFNCNDPDRSTFAGVRGGAEGMNQLLGTTKHQGGFVAYISKSPVTEKHRFDIKTDEASDMQCYCRLFDDIVLSVLFITEEDSPTASHYGIFKNPLVFLDPDGTYKNVAMKLHGFAAAAADKIFEGRKVYMVTNPMPSMTKIMTQALSPKDVHIGTNLSQSNDRLSTENRVTMKSYPPIYHKGKDGIHKIAKEGVDLKDHPDFLPDEFTELAAPPGHYLDHSSSTSGALTTVINYSALAALFQAG